MSASFTGLRTRTNARIGVLARVLPAALLAHLAGAPVGLAQVENNTQPELRDPMGGADNLPGIGDGVQVDENLVVDLHVNDEDLSNVLQMLSIQSQRNIVTSKSVSASVTANLYSVTFYEALDAILHVNGYGYIEEGNFIYVYTFEELEKIVQESRQRAWKIIKLDYLNAVDAAEFVKPLLSEGGQIKTNGVSEAFPNATLPFGADQFANEATMMISDYPEIIEEIEKLLAELDTRPAQILIEATILQSALSESNAFGVDFSIIGSLDFMDFAGAGGPLSVVNGLISGSSTALDDTGGSTEVAQPSGDYGSAIVANPGNTSGPATFKGGIVAGDVAAFIRLLDQVSDTTILSRPNILTLNRQPARVLVGKKVGYLNTTSTDTATTQTVEFLDTGTQLYVRPFVSTEGTIRMELKPQVSEASIRDATDATGAIVTIPDELTNELIANVMVRDGQTVVLGGLFRDNTSLTRRQVPFAGDLPIIGAAFRGHDDQVDRSEIIFMIKPTIVSDEVLIDQGQRANGIVERVVAGTREGLLPWSAKKRSHQLLVEADRLVEEGKYNAALHRVRRALSLHHSNAEAILIRDRIRNETTGDAHVYLDEIVYGEIEQMLDENVAPEDERTRSGNRDKNWVYEPEPEEVATDWDDVKTGFESDESTNGAETVAEVEESGPMSRAEPDRWERPATQENTRPETTRPETTDPRNAIARSSREQSDPSTEAQAAATDWKSLQQEIREEAEQARSQQASTVNPNGQTSGEGYRYAESEDTVLEVLDSVVGIDANVETASQTTTVEEPDTVSLNVNNADAATVLQMIGDLTGKTVVTPPTLEGEVTVSLNDATFEDAIEMITTKAGLDAVDFYGVTYVFGTQEVDPGAEDAPHWVWKAVDFENVQASEIIEQVRAMISSEGQAETDASIPFDAPFEASEFTGRSAVIVFDLLPNAEQLVWILEDVDARKAGAVAQGLSAGQGTPAVVGVQDDDNQ